MPRNELARIEPGDDGGPQRVEIIPAPQRDLSMDELMLIANEAVKSNLYGDLARNPSAAFMLALRCQAEGIHPGLAFAQFHIIEGKPSLRADAMMARYQQAGGRMRWLRTDAEACEAEFWHPSLMPDPVRIRKTLAEFKASGVAQGKYGLKDNWKKFPDAMLRARVISAGVRAVLPAVVCGVYTPEEVADMGAAAAAIPGPSSPTPGPEATPAIEAPPAPSFKAFCQDVSGRGHLDAVGVCRAILRRAAAIGEADEPAPAATPKDLGRAAKLVWDRDPARCVEWVEHAEGVIDVEFSTDDDDLPELGGDDRDEPEPGAPEPPVEVDIRGEYLAWVRRTADAEGLEPIDVLRIVHDAGVARKAIAAVSDRNDRDLLATRGRHFWAKDPEAASKAVDLATGGEAPPAPSKSDRLAEEL